MPARHTASTRQKVHVLLSLSAPDGTTKFVNQVVAFAPPEESIYFFSWRRAIFGRWDVFHVHWPEFLVRGRTLPVATARSLLFIVLLIRISLAKKLVVRTLHNLTPHTPGNALERRLLAWLERETTLYIELNPAQLAIGSRRSVTILHGHYIDQFAEFARAEPIAGRLLYFGRIEPYKGVDSLLTAFEGVASSSISLRIVGKPTVEMAERIGHAAKCNPRISVRFDFVPDTEMVSEITASSLVVLPYREMYNSGVLLVALSLGRPVLAPLTPGNAVIADEVGSDWLNLYDGEISAQILQDALKRASVTLDSPAPTMPGRDWRSVGEAHYQAYLAALSAPR